MFRILLCLYYYSLPDHFKIYFILCPTPFYSDVILSFPDYFYFSHIVFGLPSANILFEYFALQKVTISLHLVISQKKPWYYPLGDGNLNRPAFCPPHTRRSEDRGLFLSCSRTADLRLLFRTGTSQSSHNIGEKKGGKTGEARATPCLPLCLLYPSL